MDSLENRHAIGREAIISLSNWTSDDPAYVNRYVAFPSLSPAIQQIKKDVALLLMQKSQVINEDLRKTESNLMGEISRNVERGTTVAFDEDDKELEKNRKQLAMLNNNKKAILGTVDALVMAQSQIGEQTKRMDALRVTVQTQADKSAALEKVSKGQAKVRFMTINL